MSEKDAQSSHYDESSSSEPFLCDSNFPISETDDVLSSSGNEENVRQTNLISHQNNSGSDRASGFYNQICDLVTRDVSLEFFKHQLSGKIYFGKDFSIWPEENPLLFVVTRKGRLDLFKYLVEELGFDSNVTGPHNSHCAHIACQFGHVHMIEYMIENLKIDFSIRNDFQQTPIDVLNQSRQATEDTKRRILEMTSKLNLTGISAIDTVQDNIHQKPRNYQIDLFEKAKHENIAIVLDTGTGKTMIAVMLIYYMMQSLPNLKHIVFIAENRILVSQQAKSIVDGLKVLKSIENEDNSTMYDDYNNFIDNTVECILGESGLIGRLVKTKLVDKRIIVTTAQFLHNMLTHNVFQMEDIYLLVIDECHHTGEGDHPYKTIMTQFYHTTSEDKRPKIFGMTASALNIKSDISHKDVELKIRLERDLDCKLTTIAYGTELYHELMQYVNIPDEKIVTYEQDAIPVNISKLEKVMSRCVKAMSSSTITYEQEQTRNEYVQRLCTDILYLYYELGSWAVLDYIGYLLENIDTLKDKNPSSDNEEMLFKLNASDLYSFQDGKAFLKGSSQHCEKLELFIDDKIRGKVFERVFTFFEGKTESTQKMQLLCNMINEYFANVDDQFKALIFCDRRLTATLLDRKFKNEIPEKLRTEYLIGHTAVNATSKFTKNPLKRVTITSQQKTIEKFRNGELNCLFCTTVVEEGFDVSGCNLVIRFDSFKEYLRSYIQSRGRARKKGSVFIVMVDKADEKQNNFCQSRQELHRQMQELIHEDHSGINTPLPQEIKCEYVTSNKARATLTSSIQIINKYCGVLPAITYEDKRPKFQVSLTNSGFVTYLKFPESFPLIPKVIDNGAEEDDPIFRQNKTISKRYCALKAVKYLHEHKELDDNLLPIYRSVSSLNDLGNSTTEGSHKYVKKLPDIFNWDNVGNATTGKTKMVIHVYDIQVNSKSTDFQLLLKRNIRDIEPFLQFTLHSYKNIKLVYHNTLYFNEENYIDQCMEYHEFIFGKLTNWKTDSGTKETDSTNWRFLVIPKNPSEHFTNVPLIDLINSTEPEEMNEKVKTMVLEAKYNRKIYLAKSIKYDMSPDSEFDGERYSTYTEFFKKRWDIEISDMTQPLVEAYLPQFKNTSLSEENYQLVKLVPELVTACSFTASMLEFTRIVPELLYTLQNRLVTIEFSKVLGLFEKLTSNQGTKAISSFELLEEAITSKKAKSKVNYEKLEFFGDTVLKFVTCSQLFKLNPATSSENLTKMKQEIISNDYLASLANKTTIPQFIITQPFRPQSAIQHLKEEVLESVEMKNKDIADIIESLIGFIYVKLGMDEVLKFLDKIKFKLIESNHDSAEIRFLDMKRKFIKEVKELDEEFNSKKQRVGYVEKVEQILGYSFDNRNKGYNKELLYEAVIHPSIDTNFNYGRLSFMGNAILDLIVMGKIIDKFYLNSDEDDTSISLSSLNRLKESIVKKTTYSELCRKYNLHASIMVGENISAKFETLMNNKRLDSEMIKILSDIFQSIAAAIYLHSGENLNDVEKTYDKMWKDILDEQFKLVYTEISNNKLANSLIVNLTDLNIEKDSDSITTFIQRNLGKNPSIVWNELMQKFVWSRLPLLPADEMQQVYQEDKQAPILPHQPFAVLTIELFGLAIARGTDRNIVQAKKHASNLAISYLVEHQQWFNDKLEELVSKNKVE